MRANPISCHLITWGNDTATGMREASELGYRACETFTHNALEYEDRPEEFKELLASNNLVLSALYGGGRASEPEKAQEFIEYNTRVARFLAALGVDRIVFGPGGPRTGPTTPDALRQIAKTVEEAAKRTADLGVLACVHPHLGTEIQSREEIVEILEITDPEYVYFCPDTAHLTAAGMDAAEVIRVWGSRMQYMHLKDLTPKDANPEAWAGYEGNEALPIFCELGLGTLDFGPIMQALRDVDYTGWMTVEIDKSTSTPYNSLEQCRNFVVDRLGLSLDLEE